MKIPGIFNKNTSFTLLNYDHIQELISEGLTEKIIKILSQIEISYPFTFLEKEGIREVTDKLDNFFWIKNRYGFVELVNQKLTEYFNTSFAQLEENHEELFFPVESRRIIKSFNDIVCETKKAVRIEGIKFIDKENEEKFNLINIPIIDEEDTVIALICISVQTKVEKKSETVENYPQKSIDLNQFPFAAAILSSSGQINKINAKFQELFSSKHHELENSLINEVFLPKFIQVYKEFIASKNTEISIESSELLLNQTGPLLFLLGKIFDKKSGVVTVMLAVKNVMAKIKEVEQANNLGMIENLIRNNPDAVLICDKENLKFLEVNEAAINLYGYRRDEFLQMDLTDLYSAEDIQLLLDSSNVNIKEGSFHGPYKHKKKDGTSILVEMSRYNVKFQDREAHFNLVRNVSDKLEVEKKNQSFKSVFDNTDNLIFITDSSGFIHFLNKSVTETLGYTKNDLLNSSIAAIVSDEDRSRANLSIFHADKKETSEVTLNLKTLDGRLLAVELIVSPILDFNKEIESYTLIGKVKQNIFSTLPESSKQTKEDSAATDAAKETIDSKFLADLFHELLTPINVILGFAQDITNSINQPTAEQKEAAEIIKQNRTNLLQSMNAAIEYASLSDKDLNFLPAETKITDVIDQLQKDADELRGTLNVEFAYGKISSSLKFETDRQRFKYFLLLLFKITASLSGQRKIYFSAYPRDKEHFLVTFRDLQAHCSKSLVNQLYNIFYGTEIISGKEFEVLKMTLLLAQKLLNILKGKFVIIGEEKDRNDYGIIFPISYSKTLVEEIKQENVSEKSELVKDEKEKVSSPEEKDDSEIKTLQPGEDKKQKAKLSEDEELAAKLQNELRIEALREKIRKREEQKKSKKIQEDEEVLKNSGEDELIEDKIEYFDLDLQENVDDQPPAEEEEIEIIETFAPKEKAPKPAVVKQIDEKVDVSNLSCLYFEDQIDSQILFSVQMKGLKNLNFAVSFEEGLPLLESGNYDFIVIDINLQGSYNGLDILRILRTMPKYENIPVFAVTAYVLPGDQQKFVLAGFNGFIAKPIFRDQMIDLLAEVFNEPKQS
jgi:PAS domain S-box-containing protein